MRISEWMTPAPVTVTPSTPMTKVHQLMVYRGIRHLPVVDDGRLVGIVTDRDVRTVQPSPATSFATGEINYMLERLTVRAVMSRPVITVPPDGALADAVRLMLENKVGGLPVMDRERLVGIITEVDLLRAFSTTLGVPAGRPARPADAPIPETSHPRLILVPLDGTSGSEAILEIIGEIARAEGAAVRLLQVKPPTQEIMAEGRVVVYSNQESARVEAEAHAYFTRVAKSLAAVTVEFAVRFGEPAEQIVKEAGEARATLIAMASHRRTGIARIVRGSVAERVERATTIPVMLVRHAG